MMAVRYNRRSTGPFHIFSNLAFCRVRALGQVFSSVEHAYQFLKVVLFFSICWLLMWCACLQVVSFEHSDAAVRVLGEEKPFEAMQAVKGVLSGTEKRHWDDIKIQVMKALLFLKFSYNEDAKNILLSTGQSELIESTPHPFWGGEKGGGNMHGRLLMQVRTMFQTGRSFCPNICVSDSICFSMCHPMPS